MLACIFNVLPHYRKEIYQLLDREFQCDFYAGDKLPLPLKKMDPNLLKGFNGLLQNIYLYKQIYWQKGIYRVFIKKYTSYLITGDPYCLSSWLLLLYGRLSSKKVYVWAHGLNGHEGRIRRFFKKIFFKLSYKSFVYSDLARNYMISLGFKEEKVITIYNSLSYTEQLKVRKFIDEKAANNVKDETPYIIYVGRIQEDEKKLYHIIEAIQQLKEEGSIITVLLVGRIIQDNKLRKLINKYKLENQVIFYGPLFDESELGKLFYHAKSCVCPGNIGLTAIHSHNYGCPVITHNDFKIQMPEFEAIQPGITGDFFKKDDINDLRIYINKWNNVDKERRRITQKKCFDIIDNKFNPYFQLKIFKENLLD